MKPFLLITIFILSTLNLVAQKVEFSIQASSALADFTGISTVSGSSIVQGNDEKSSYTTNPYSTKPTFSYSFGAQVQLITKSGFIAGVQATYETLRSRTPIDTVHPYYFYFADLPGPLYASSSAARGETIFQESFINLTPYFGYRLRSGAYHFDLMPGADIGFTVNSNVSGSATSYGTTYPVNYKPEQIKRDIRLRMGVAAGYQHYALTASYSRGLSSYLANNDGKAFSQLFRLGLAYTF